MTDAPRQGGASKAFRIAVWVIPIILLLAGLIAWIAKNNLSEPDQRSPKELALVFVAWLGAVALCALLLLLASVAQEFLQALGAMALPLGVVLVSAYVLFFNDQGRELGVSLMIGDPVGLWRFVILFFALIYWGVNNWHSGRLGIHAALERGELGVRPRHPMPHEPRRHVVNGDERWLFWLPRLLGVFAHLFAAINLSLAAWRQPAPLGWSLWVWTLVAWTAPFVILLFTGLAYEFDRSAISKRRDDTEMSLRKYAAPTAGGFIFIAMALLVLLESYRPLHAFVLGTFVISLSAFVFLIFVSWLRSDKPLGPDASVEERREDDAKEEPRLVWWTLGLFAVAVAMAVAVWISPTAVGWAFGSMAVAYFAMGALLAAVNVFHYGVVRLIQSGLLGKVRKPRVVAASIAAAVVLLAVVNAWLHTFHSVRRCADQSCAEAASAADHPVMPDDRPTVAQAAQAWYRQARTAFAERHPGWDENSGVPVPMVIVATAGGGIRAAYWTAAVLDKLGAEQEGGARPYLFAVSGVSGGSVGATAFEAALAKRDEGRCDGACPDATSFLTEDFLAPVLASGIFIDAVASFLPEFPHADRGVALERSFEQASGGLLARPFLSLFPYGGDGAIHGPWRPILLLNATHEETGRRIIAGSVLIERNVFLDSFDELHELRSDVPASTAAHNSARFAYVSPAGDLGEQRGSMIDGGYFENFGALTALELARAAEAALDPPKQKPKVKLVFLLISSDPDLDDPSPGKRTAPVRIDEPASSDGRCQVSITEPEPEPPPILGGPNYLPIHKGQVVDAWINEFVAPFHGLENAREAHGNRAAAELAVTVCPAFPNPSEGPAGETADSPTPSKVQVANVATAGESVVAGALPAASADAGGPYFAHVAMCRGDKDGHVAVNPPLGWVLSEATRAGLKDLLCRCGNTDQMTQLKAAMSLPGGWTCSKQQETAGLWTWADAPQRYSASR
jgi:hypothetical protein